MRKVRLEERCRTVVITEPCTVEPFIGGMRCPQCANPAHRTSEIRIDGYEFEHRIRCWPCSLIWKPEKHYLIITTDHG